MTRHAHTDVEENRQSLWLLVWPPAIWAVHFLGSYALAAVWCRGNGAGGEWLGILIAAPAAVALGLVGFTGWIGWKKHNLAGGELPHDGDSAEDRTRFLGYATVLLATLSAIAIVYVGVAAWMFGACR